MSLDIAKYNKFSTKSLPTQSHVDAVSSLSHFVSVAFIFLLLEISIIIIIIIRTFSVALFPQLSELNALVHIHVHDIYHLHLLTYHTHTVTYMYMIYTIYIY